MKIDELSIDHNALKCIEDAVTDVWALEVDSVINKDIVMYVRGVLDMANAMKEVLK